MTAITQQVRNGVDSAQMYGRSTRSRPIRSLGRFQFRVANECQGGAHNRSTIQRETPWQRKESSNQQKEFTMQVPSNTGRSVRRRASTGVATAVAILSLVIAAQAQASDPYDPTVRLSANWTGDSAFVVSGGKDVTKVLASSPIVSLTGRSTRLAMPGRPYSVTLANMHLSAQYFCGANPGPYGNIVTWDATGNASWDPTSGCPAGQLNHATLAGWAADRADPTIRTPILWLYTGGPLYPTN
jgi:hypothetical protein